MMLHIESYICLLKKLFLSQALAVHTFNLNTPVVETGCFNEFKANLVYKLSSRTARAVI